jgi:ribosomal protein S18 acetylase RimI-like enzyme
MASEIELGALARGHRERIREILDATGAFRPDEVDVAIELFDESLQSTNGDYEFVGAFDRERLVGYACFGPTPSTDRTFDLYWIAVDPAAHSRGTGSRLLAEVERRLIQRRGRLLIVETSSRTDYAASRRFYEARGYAESARIRDFYAPGDDRVIYRKLFPSQAELSGDE